MSGKDRFYVFTGGPGAGKSTLVDALGRAAWPTMPEAGRSIIVDQVVIGGHALPWADKRLYLEASLVWDIRSYREAEQLAGPVFFDRGVTDSVAAFESLGTGLPEHVHAAALAFPCHPTVFVAPPWPEIYTHDTERKQSLDDARRTYDALTSVYTRYGYDLIELPLAPVQDRVDFVLAEIGLL